MVSDAIHETVKVATPCNTTATDANFCLATPRNAKPISAKQSHQKPLYSERSHAKTSERKTSRAKRNKKKPIPSKPRQDKRRHAMPRRPKMHNDKTRKATPSHVTLILTTSRNAKTGRVTHKHAMPKLTPDTELRGTKPWGPNARKHRLITSSIAKPTQATTKHSTYSSATQVSSTSEATHRPDNGGRSSSEMSVSFHQTTRRDVP